MKRPKNDKKRSEYPAGSLFTQAKSARVSGARRGKTFGTLPNPLVIRAIKTMLTDITEFFVVLNLLALQKSLHDFFHFRCAVIELGRVYRNGDEF